MDNIELFFSDSRGIYIPRDFVEIVERDKVSGISEEQYTILEDGPDNEFYWEVWEEVLDSAKVTASCGKTFSLHQDGDLWLIDYNNASEDDLNNFFDYR